MELPLLRRKTIAEGTTELAFSLDGVEFNFRAGQYVSVILPNPPFQDPRGNLREFSISSSPNNREALTVTFRDSGSPFKRGIAAIPLGIALGVDGPFGAFTLPKKTDRPLVLVAGGIGIAPFMSMARYAAEEHLPHRITLLYGNSAPERAAYREELQTLIRKNKQFTVHERYGEFTAAFIGERVSDIAGSRFYIAGPPRMVAAIREALRGAGAGEDDILFEEFTGYP